MGLMIPIGKNGDFVIGQMTRNANWHSMDMVYYEETYVDESDKQLHVVKGIALHGIEYYIRINYDSKRKFKSGRWTVQLMEYVHPKDRKPNDDPYRCWKELEGRHNTPLAAHRAAMDHIRFKEMSPKLACGPWYMPPQIR